MGCEFCITHLSKIANQSLPIKYRLQVFFQWRNQVLLKKACLKILGQNLAKKAFQIIMLSKPELYKFLHTFYLFHCFNSHLHNNYNFYKFFIKITKFDTVVDFMQIIKRLAEPRILCRSALVQHRLHNVSVTILETHRGSCQQLIYARRKIKVYKVHWLQFIQTLNWILVVYRIFS